MSAVFTLIWSAATCRRLPAWLTCQPSRTAFSGARSLGMITPWLRAGKQRDGSRFKKAATGRSTPNFAFRVPHSAFHR